MTNVENINELTVSIDWLSFTFFTFASPFDVLAHLGFDPTDFTAGRGKNGYKASLRHNLYPVSVLYDGSENMGIHVDISGLGVSPALDAYVSTLKCPCPFGGEGFEYPDENLMTAYLRHIHDSAKFTRVDLAVDDKGMNYYSVNDVLEICRSKRCSSRFRSFNIDCGESFSGGIVGNTLYLGKRQSYVYMRIYDKRLEQMAKNVADPGYDWIRWELELKKARAEKAVEYLLSGSCLGSVAIGILSNYFRVIVRDNENVSRCSTDPLWSRFVSSVEKLRLTVGKTVKSLDEKERWIKKQVMPILAALVASKHGDMSFITDLLPDALYRNNKAVLDMVFKENPDLREGLVYDIG